LALAQLYETRYQQRIARRLGPAPDQAGPSDAAGI